MQETYIGETDRSIYLRIGPHILCGVTKRHFYGAQNQEEIEIVF